MQIGKPRHRVPAIFTNHAVGRWSRAQKADCSLYIFVVLAGLVFIVVHRLSIVAAHGAFSLVVV